MTFLEQMREEHLTLATRSSFAILSFHNDCKFPHEKCVMFGAARKNEPERRVLILNILLRNHTVCLQNWAFCRSDIIVPTNIRIPFMGRYVRPLSYYAGWRADRAKDIVAEGDGARARKNDTELKITGGRC